MRIEKHAALKPETRLGSPGIFLSFLRDLDQKVESYIETVEVLNEHPNIAKKLRKATKGKYSSPEKLAKKHGLE